MFACEANSDLNAGNDTGHDTIYGLYKFTHDITRERASSLTSDCLNSVQARMCT